MSDRRVALVVTVDRYDDPGLHDLAAPSADARALADALGRPDLGGFDLEFLHNPTSWSIYEKVEGLLADCHPSDLVLLHFSCHGLKDLDGELYLASTNTRPERLASTAVDSAWINRMMQRSRAQRVVLLLDCCYGGAFERGVLARAGGGVDVGDQFRPGGLGESRGRVVITASTAMEYAFEGPTVSDGGRAAPSVFTGALVAGIRTGEADRDQDGYVALDELYDYVYDRVQRDNPHQTPCKWEFGLRGELYVARNPNRRPVLAALPAELLELAEHATPAGRLAAVAELAELAHLAGAANPARAAAARAALTRMADDDSRRVSTSAAEALSRAGAAPDRGDPPAVPPGPRRRFGARTAGLVGAGVVLAAVIGVSMNAIGQTQPRAAASAPTTARSANTAPSLDRPVRQAGFAAGREPEGVAVAPDGRTVYVADEGSRSLVAIDAARPATRTEVALPATPRFVAVSPDGRRAYVSMYFEGGSHSGVAIVDAATRTLARVVPTGPKPFALTVAPDGRVWVPIHDSSRVQIIDPARPAVAAEIVLPESPHAVALSADGSRAFTPDHESNVVSVIDGRSRAVLAAVPVGRSPHHLAVSPDGRTVVVADYDGNTVHVIDTRTRRAGPAIRVGRHPQSVAFARDGGHAYVVNEGDGTVSTLDPGRRLVTSTVPVGRSPRSIAVSPDGQAGYVTSGGSGALVVLKLS